MFKANVAAHGAGLLVEFFSVVPDTAFATVTRCIFYRNRAHNTGGGITCWIDTAPAIINCTISCNESETGVGGGLFSRSGSSPTLDNTIISFNCGAAVTCDAQSNATLSCCDLFMNTGGNWTGCIAGQNGVNGNFTADPLFCAGLPEFDFLSLQEASPCAPGNHPAEVNCGLIGALPVGCQTSGLTTCTLACFTIPTEEQTWGRTKFIYRKK